MRVFLVISLIISLAIVIASFFYPKISNIVVNNNSHYSTEEVEQLANIQLNQPFFWITGWKSKPLIEDPWIQSATIYKRWPDTVSIVVNERKPILSNGLQNFAIDGTILNNVSVERQKALIRFEGWGKPRLDEALELTKIFAHYDLKKIKYSPSGLTIQIASTELFTPSLDMLKAHWGSFLSQVGKYKYLYFYPWGVSGRNE